MDTTVKPPAADVPASLKNAILAPLGERSIVLVGLMGVGKTSIGRRLAARLGLDFVDADEEIEAAAGLTIPEIFEKLGEPAFRDGEKKVIARLLQGPRQVLATGGGAFVDPDTRAAVSAQAVSIWLKADTDLIMKRVERRNNRPLLQVEDPRSVIEDLIAKRSPFYAEADITIESQDGPHEDGVDAVLAALQTYLAAEGHG